MNHLRFNNHKTAIVFVLIIANEKNSRDPHAKPGNTNRTLNPNPNYI